MEKLLIIAATKNKHKLAEFREIFATVSGYDTEVIAEDEAVRKYLPDLKYSYEAPEETGKTFQANAFIKAAGLYKFLGKAIRENQNSDILIVADDSGLCVTALDGAPGVMSARYASNNDENASDSDNVDKLLREMENIPDGKRNASFVCSISAFLIKIGQKNFTLLVSEGHMPGVIAKEPRGENGFGYDPILYLPDYGKSVAELEASEKNAISHRGQALRGLAAKYYGIC